MFLKVELSTIPFNEMTSTGPILFCIIQCPFTRKAIGQTFSHRPVKGRNLILSNHILFSRFPYMALPSIIF